MTKALSVLALCLLTGCSAYRLGGPKPAFTTLDIAPVRNTTNRPVANGLLQQKLTESFAGDPRIKLGPGGAKLDVAITQFRRDGLTTKSTDAFFFTSFRLTFVVRCTLTNADGKVLFRERDFTANATLRPIGNAAGEERSLDGPIFADLAAQIREAATTAW
jgi:hypothetical protein